MSYKQEHLRGWLKERPLLKIALLEEEAGLAKDTIYHFKNDRRGFPDKHYDKLVNILYKYGFRELDSE